MPNALRPIHTNDLIELSQWCRRYQLDGHIMPQPVAVRFLIGMYQIQQAIEWRSGPAAEQGYAAAVLHFLMVAEAFDLGIEQHLTPDLRDVDDVCPPWDRFWAEVCKAAQMLVYEQHSVGSTRKSRVNRDSLCLHLGNVIRWLLVRIPCDQRAQRLHDETVIVTRDLVKKVPATLAE